MYLVRSCVAALAVSVLCPMIASAETAWTAAGGYSTLSLDQTRLNELGITVQKNQITADSAAVALEHDQQSDLTILSTGSHVTQITNGAILISDSLTIVTPAGLVSLDGMAVRIHSEGNGQGWSASLTAIDSDVALFDLINAKASFAARAVPPYLEIRGADLRVTALLAEKLGEPSLSGLVIGRLDLRSDVIFAGGDEEPDAQPQDDATPRAGIGPDVIVGGVGVSGFNGSDPNDWVAGAISGNIKGYSVATTSCNIGDEDLDWFDCTQTGNPQCAKHPVISQNMFRLKNGRFEQLGQSWLKHGFCALDEFLCTPTCPQGTCDTLGVGCSDPYTAQRNTTNLGPKSLVNPFTGVFPYPFSMNPIGNQNIAGRLQLKVEDINPALNAGALYWVETMYTTQDDAAAGNADNNASHRPVAFAPTTFNLSFLAPTIQMKPAIREWKTQMPSVVETEIRVPNEGLMILAANATDNGNGTWHYEYALFNQNSDRAARTFSVPVAGAVVTNIGFHDVDYHSGEPYANTDWFPLLANGVLTWSTQTFAQNPNANALRWGTLYNFRFDANVPPAEDQGDVTIGLFKPGTPTSITASTVVPAPAPLFINLSGEAPTTLLPACTPTSFDVTITPGADVYADGSAMLNYRFDDGDFLTAPLVPIGDNVYRATLPPCPCDGTPQFYLSAQGSLGEIAHLPVNAPTGLFAPDVGELVEIDILSADFESGIPADWTATGLWNATASCPVTPDACNAGQFAYFGQPATCNYDTGAAANGDLSFNVTVPSTGTVRLKYCSNFQREAFAMIDWPSVRVADLTVDQPAFGGLGSSGWVERTVNLTPFSGQTVTVKFNFNTTDNQSNAFRGWQIDNVRVYRIELQCNAEASAISGDLDGDGHIDGRDLAEFVVAALAQSAASQYICTADFNGDGVISALDADGMANALLSAP